MATIGPSGWEIALVAALELGVSAAITAGFVNWLLIRRRRIRSAYLTPVTVPAAFAEPAEAAGTAAAGGTMAGHGISEAGPDALAGSGDVQPSGAWATVPADVTDDLSGHRIYLDPWAADKAEAQATEQSGERPGLGSSDPAAPFPGSP
jgi:hypothetical protein